MMKFNPFWPARCRMSKLGSQVTATPVTSASGLPAIIPSISSWGQGVGAFSAIHRCNSCAFIVTLLHRIHLIKAYFLCVLAQHVGPICPLFRHKDDLCINPTTEPTTEPTTKPTEGISPRRQRRNLEPNTSGQTRKAPRSAKSPLCCQP